MTNQVTAGDLLALVPAIVGVAWLVTRGLVRSWRVSHPLRYSFARTGRGTHWTKEEFEKRRLVTEPTSEMRVCLNAHLPAQFRRVNFRLVERFADFVPYARGLGLAVPNALAENAITAQISQWAGCSATKAEPTPDDAAQATDPEP